MTAYLAMISVRLVELHRVLKTSGSIYLHCDQTAGHSLKMRLDTVFGAQRFAERNGLALSALASEATAVPTDA